MRSGKLRVQPHLRGHVAACNGRVELVRARAEPCSLGDNVIDSRELQARAEEIRRRKEERLLAFQKDVKERVRRKERARLKQLSETANTHPLEKEAGSSVGKWRPQVLARGSPSLCEREEVTVRLAEPGSAVQRARLSLLSASRPTPLPPPAEREEPLLLRPVTPASPPPASPRGERSAGRRYTAPDRLALDRRRSHAQQLHLFHRLYSQLEREGARQRRVRQALRGNAELRRRESEIQRRMAEEGDHGVLVSVESCGEEERERLEEWHQTLALEKRRHQLQVARETERYLEALRAQLRDRLASCPTPPPPLCACGSTIWDTDPLTCANNCPFYQNPRAYASALTNLLNTLKL